MLPPAEKDGGPHRGKENEFSKMSQHASLRIDPTRTKHRNVLKRHERIHRLQETDRWSDQQSGFGLPKVKSLKIKMKKIKSEKAEGQAAAAPGAAPAPAAAASEKKKAAPPAKKSAEKK